MTADQVLVRRLQAAVATQLQQAALTDPDHERQFAHAKLLGEIQQLEADRLEQGQAPLDYEVEAELVEAVLARLFGAGRLQQLLEDDEVENIDINACDEVFVTYATGKQVRWDPVADSDEELVEQIQTLGSYAGLSARPFDVANPALDLRLPDGSRLSALQAVSTRPATSIRRHRHPNPRLGEFVDNGTLDSDLAEFLSAAVRARANIMLAGPTDAGKTTLLRALANEIDPAERIITVERALELGLRHHRAQHPNVVELEERLANSEGRGAVTLADLVQRTLRMNPDRVIVGEVLGPEVVTMLNAMGQGNDGSLSTLHARSANQVLTRLVTLARQAEEKLDPIDTHLLVSTGLDFIVYLTKRQTRGHRNTDADNDVRRFASEVVEITGFDGNQAARSQLWEPDAEGRATRTATPIMRAEQLADAGYDERQGG